MKFRRKKYLINSSLQIRYAILFVIIAVLGNMGAVALFNMLALKRLDAVMWSTHIGIESTNELLNPLFVSVNATMFMFITVLLIVTGVLMIRKASGPLYRISKDVERIAKGDLSAGIVLRERDEFQEVAETLNASLTELRSAFIAIAGKHTDISRLLGDLKKPDRKDTEVTVVNYNDLFSHIKDIEAQLNRFKI